MSFTLDLSPEMERRLRSEAATRGVDAKEYARLLVENALAPAEVPRRSLWETATDEDWIRAFDEWMASLVPPKGRPLPASALRREGLYDDRGI